MRFITIAATLLILAPLSIAAHAAENCPTNLIPMYEGVVKNAAMLKADEELRRSVADQGFTQQQGAQRAVDNGWTYFLDKGDPVTAMKRFNQGWLLDTDNGGAYHGMAVMTEVLRNSGQFANCPYSPALSEQVFKMALTKPSAEPTAKVDYGRFLWTQDRLDESIKILREVTATTPQAMNARSNLAFVYYRTGDFVQACDWAKQARTVGDALEPGFLEDMCARAK